MNDRASNRGLQASSGWRDQLLTWNIPHSDVLNADDPGLKSPSFRDCEAFGFNPPRDLKMLQAESLVLTRRLLWLLWVAAIASFLGVWLVPVSNRITRFGGVVLLLVCWFGLLSLTWRHHRIRIGLLVITGLAAGFLIMPAPTRSASQTLRQDYLVGLRRYTGVTYYWGGESFKGIDCSGLIPILIKARAPDPPAAKP